jgi:hypothetical protein
MGTASRSHEAVSWHGPNDASNGLEPGRTELDERPMQLPRCGGEA